MEGLKTSIPRVEKEENASIAEKLKIAAESYKEKFDIKMAELMDRVGKNPHFQNLHERDSF